MKEVWKEEYERWSKRDLAQKKYVSIWADEVHFGVRLEDASQCILVVIGAAPNGKKELLAMTDDYRESEASWKELLLDLKQRGLAIDPKLAIGDGARGLLESFAASLRHDARARAGWKHKTANVLNKLPVGQQAKARGRLARDLGAERASPWLRVASMPNRLSITSYRRTK